MRTHVNKIENRITFKIKTGYYLKLLTPETMKLLGSTKNKITKDKIDENVSHLEIKVVLAHCNIINKIPNKSFGQLLDISLIENFHTLKYRLLIKNLNL